MSRLFFDHLIEIRRIRYHIDRISESHEEKTDMWALVDEYVNNRVLSLLLSELDEEFHDDFMQMFLERPYDDAIVKFLNERLNDSFENIMGRNLPLISSDLMEILEIEESKKTKDPKKKVKKSKS